jgi:hypothetical protein
MCDPRIEVVRYIALMYAVGLAPIVLIEGVRLFTGKGGLCSFPAPPPVPLFEPMETGKTK